MNEITAVLLAEFGFTRPSDRSAHGVWNTLAVHIDAEWVPEEVRTAMYGIDWARRTGRLPATVEYALRDLSDWHWCHLIGETAANCDVQGEVPAYLIATFTDAA